MPKYKVSLVIPAYNEEKYIAACLDHAINVSIVSRESAVAPHNCVDGTDCAR